MKNLDLKKLDWKLPLLIYGAMSVIFFFAFFYAAFNNNYPVDHSPAVPGNSNWPEHYVISISPALAFKYTWSLGRVLGLLIWFGVGVYMVLVSNDIIGKKENSLGGIIAREKNIWKVVALGCLIACVLFFASYSNVVAGNNTKVVTPEQFKEMGDDKAKYKALFNKKELER